MYAVTIIYTKYRTFEKIFKRLSGFRDAIRAQWDGHGEVRSAIQPTQEQVLLSNEIKMPYYCKYWILATSYTIFIILLQPLNLCFCLLIESSKCVQMCWIRCNDASKTSGLPVFIVRSVCDAKSTHSYFQKCIWWQLKLHC